MTTPLDDPRLAYHRSQAIRDPHNAAYHETAADLIEARTVLRALLAACDQATTWVLPPSVSDLLPEVRRIVD